uniref:Uncharacterized protein n=1 Tax=Glossina palpalis gambiensis TaxID=67801 RepID=A0A1B0BB85_9MUSC
LVCFIVYLFCLVLPNGKELRYVISLNFSNWSQRCLVYEIDVWSLNYLIAIVYSFSASTSCFYYQPNIMKNTTRFEDFPCKKIQLIFRPIRSLSGAREVVKRIYCVQLLPMHTVASGLQSMFTYR